MIFWHLLLLILVHLGSSQNTTTEITTAIIDIEDEQSEIRRLNLFDRSNENCEQNVCGYFITAEGVVEDMVSSCVYDTRRRKHKNRCTRVSMLNNLKKPERLESCGCCTRKQVRKRKKFCSYKPSPCGGDALCRGRKNTALSRVCYTDVNRQSSETRCVHPFKNFLEKPNDSFTCGECPSSIEPTSDPTLGPTHSPTIHPTSSSTEVPTYGSTGLPTSSPTPWSVPDSSASGVSPSPTFSINCGCPESCTSSVLAQMATDNVASIPCGIRILWAINNLNLSEEEACSSISDRFPDTCGQGCDPDICGPRAPPPSPLASGPAETITSSIFVDDCGCPATCTSAVLDQVATDGYGSHDCRSRIEWVMANTALTNEQDACAQVSSEFPSICGNGCDPTTCNTPPGPPPPPPSRAPTPPPTLLPTPPPTSPPKPPPTPPTTSMTNCGCPETCTSNVLDRMATDDIASIACGTRILWAINNLDFTEEKACTIISGRFPDTCGPECDPNVCGTPTTSSGSVGDCGCPATCNDNVLSQVATDGNGSHDCRSRIEWVMANTALTNEQDACAQVSSEFPTICGNGCDPNTCETPSGPPPGPAGPPPQPSGPSPQSGELVFAEEFDEGDKPNPAIWTYDQGDWGWGNAELQRYTNLEENVQISPDGKLVVTAVRRGNLFTSGRIKTLDKFTFKYGSVEASIKVPDLRSGLWPAFWTLGNSFPTVGWPKCGEIDIMEMGNAAPGNNILNQRVGSAAHWFNDPAGRATYGLYLDTEDDLSQAFHTFSMDWTPDMITTYVDGKKIWAIDISPEQCPPEQCSEFHDFHFFLLNLAVGGSYTGLLSAGQISAHFPARYEIDYVRVYANDWTEIGGSYITGEPTAKYDLTDCGCPATCTPQQLDRMAQDSSGNYSCRERIEWVIGNLGSTEEQACKTVSGEFPSICAQACNPDAC
eukprot:scaffold23456_cov144-Cylindrotheca_fusiformis.AAC.5